MKRALAITLVLCGCSHAHTQVDVGARSANAAVQVHVEGGRSLAALLGLTLLVAGYEAERAGLTADSRAVPELDPSRKVSEQDCTKPLDYSLGNIRCK